MNRRDSQRAYLKYLAPTMLVIFLLTLVPIAVTVGLSLTSLSYRSANPTEFVGLQNYVRLFSDDRFLNSIPISIILIVVPVAVTVGPRLHRRRRHEREAAVDGLAAPGLRRAYGAAAHRHGAHVAHTIHAPTRRRQLLPQPDRRGRAELALRPHLRAGGRHRRRRVGMDAFRGAHVS